jgi:AbiV family abortive infection protein
MKDLFNMKESEYKIGSEMSLKNAKDHLEIARLAETINLHGISISHLILSLEELAKASILKLKSVNKELKIKNFRQYFKSHGIKHDAIFKFYIAALYYNSDEDDLNLQNDKHDDWPNLLIFFITLLVVLVVNQDDTDTLEESPLDNIRNSGFYVNFNEKTSEWESPNLKFDKSFNEYYEIVIQIFSALEETLFKNKISNENLIRFVSLMNDEKINITQLERLENKRVK